MPGQRAHADAERGVYRVAARALPTRANRVLLVVEGREQPLRRPPEEADERRVAALHRRGQRAAASAVLRTRCVSEYRAQSRGRARSIDERALEVRRRRPRAGRWRGTQSCSRQNAAAAVRHERIRKRRPSFRHVEMSHWRRRTFRRRRVAAAGRRRCSARTAGKRARHSHLASASSLASLLWHTERRIARLVRSSSSSR